MINVGLPVKVAARKREKFLAALSESASVRASCKLAGVSRQSVYTWRSKDESFLAAWDEAIELGLDALEDALQERAKDGTRRPIYQGGKLVGHEQVYDNRAAEFILRCRRPDRYGDRTSLDVHLTAELPARMAAGDKRLEKLA